VKVDASEYEGWWYEGGGIYRHTWLIKTGKLHIALFGTYVTTPSVSSEQAIVSISTLLKNENKTGKDVTLISKITDNKGVALGTKTSTLSIEPFSQKEITQKGNIQKPLLWSPETPNLYYIKYSLKFLKKGILLIHTKQLLV